MSRLFIIFIQLIALLITTNSCVKKKINDSIDIEKIEDYISKSRNSNFDIDTRVKYIDSSLVQLNKSTNDSITNNYLLKVSFSSLIIVDSTRFFNTIEKSYNTSKALKDSIKIAKIFMYKGLYYEDTKQSELAYGYYYKAKGLFYNLNDKMRYGSMLSRIGKLETDFHQYNRAENNLINAIQIFDDLNRNDLLYHSYNRLGNLKYLEKDYNSSKLFFHKAKDYLNISSPNDSLSLSAIENNLGNCALADGYNSDAIKFYKRALLYSNLKKEDEVQYLRIKDNLIYAEFLDGYNLNFQEIFDSNKKEKEQIEDISGVFRNRIYYASYLEKKGNINEAIETLKQTLSLSKEKNNTLSEVECLEKLINLDSTNNRKYFTEFIDIKTEQDKVERKTENRLGLIRMETDRYKTESKNYKNQREWLFIFTGFLLILSITLIIFNKQKLKLTKIIHEKNEVEKIQQLITKHNIEIVKTKESTVKSISRNLHDDISSRLFGIRSNLKLLNTKTDEKNIRQRDELLIELNKVEKDVRTLSHGLRNKFESDFKNAIDHLFKVQFSIEEKINYSITSEFYRWKVLSELQKVELYRIIQEITSNVIKHSNASLVTLSFSEKADNLLIEIKDDGIGFDISKQYAGIGLKNIKERASQIETKLEIESSPGQGTKIILLISI